MTVHDIAITASGLSKRYQVRHSAAQADNHTDFRDLLVKNAQSLVSNPSQWLRNRGASPSPSNTEEFWAINNVSFEIRQGECVGIIGRNGAGKSTLLKILSRITAPTSGRAEITGRVASLLEVGTGFHPELSGRENIFLNGAILGMGKAEISRKMDEIISFAEVEKFVDTPVKRYSSGMYVRLAFSVAAHLEPEILIVDEVLAVGDAQFQRKCIGLMQRYSKEGRTILFVSHSMASVRNLCNRAICLERGQVHSTGPTQDVITDYLGLGAVSAQTPLSARTDRSGNGSIRFLSFELRDTSNKKTLHGVPSGETCVLRIRFSTHPAHRYPATLNLEIGIDDAFGNRISHLSNVTTRQPLVAQSTSGCFVDIEMLDMPLCKGVYSLTLFATVGDDIADWVKNAGSLQVVEGDFFRSGQLPPTGQGIFYMRHSFTTGAID